MISRLPITLAQLKAVKNLKKLKYEISKVLYSLYCSKKLTKKSIITWSILFKNGNNIYER